MLEELLSGAEIGRRVTTLRERKKALKKELFDGDEKLVGKHEEIRALELSLSSAERNLNRLILRDEARQLLELEGQLEVLDQRKEEHADLIEMSQAPPPASSNKAVIFASSSLCPDCIDFKDRVNDHFGLSLQLFAAL